MFLSFFQIKTGVLGVLAVMVMQLAVAHHPDHNQETNAGDEQIFELGENFSYINDAGKLAKVSDIDASITAIFFGFTNCIDVCPGTLAKLAASMVEGEFSQQDFKVLFISIDPTHDDRLAIKNYLQLFGKDFLGGRLLSNETEHVSSEFGLYVQDITNGEGTPNFSHTSGIYLFNKSNQAVSYLSGDTEVEQIVTTIQALLES